MSYCRVEVGQVRVTPAGLVRVLSATTTYRRVEGVRLRTRAWKCSRLSSNGATVRVALTTIADHRLGMYPVAKD